MKCSATIQNKYKLIWIRRFGKNLKSLSIFEMKKLNHWAVTHSHKDGCLQAHLLIVIVFFYFFFT